MFRALIFLIALIIIEAPFVTSQCRYGHPQWTGEWFWNQRYQMGYDQARRFYGFWSYNCDLRGTDPVVQWGYGKHYNNYAYDSCSGCSCNDGQKTINCSLPSTQLTTFVKRKGYFHTVLWPGYFRNGSTEITLLGVPLQNLDGDVFVGLENLTDLIIHNTDLQDFPNLDTNIKLSWLDLSRNEISFTYPTEHEIHIPPSLTHVNLVENQISWIPPELFAGTNVRFLALSSNNIGPLVPAKSFINMPFLQYISFDANNIEQLSRTEMDLLSESPLQHLNLSHNQISCVQDHTFDNLTQLKILEMHHNDISDFTSCLFAGLPEIMHIDISHNSMKKIRRNAFHEMPNLRRIRLHNQQIECIDYRAFVNLPNLREIFISSNELPEFPHAVFEWHTWNTLHSIHADNNRIKSIEDYTKSSFKGREWELYCNGLPDFVPFRNLPNLHSLRLSHNEIPSIEADTFCLVPKLTHLTLHYNLLTSTSLHRDVFLCTQQLHYLQLSGNRFEYVPPAVIGRERLPVIHEIVLNNNNIAYVEANDFSEFDNLHELWLSNNRITAIEDNAFPPNLVQLWLRNNKFFTFKHENPFANLTLLRELYLDRNAIEYLPPHAFDNLQSLQNLFLYNNKIAMIPHEAFQDSPKINELLLYNNEISHIEDGAFSYIDHDFRYFRIDNNRLSHLPDPAFDDFLNLRADNVYFQNNRIERIRKRQFCGVTSAHHFRLESNRITTIESQGFKSVSIPDDIHLQGNSIKYLEPFAFDDVRAEELFMPGVVAPSIGQCAFHQVTVYNWRMDTGRMKAIEPGAFCDVRVNNVLRLDSNQISDIQGQIFYNGSFVRHLWLHNNLLTSLPDDAFAGATITTISLYNNQLDTYPLALNAQRLTSINLNSNQIRALPSNAFDGQDNVRTLSLSGNKLTELRAEVFDELIRLEVLYLSNNDIEVIEEEVFTASLPRLRHIDLRDNNFHHLPAFEELSSLQTLYLNGNPNLKTIAVDAFDHVSDTLTEVRLYSVQLYCNCETVKALYEIQHVIKSTTTGICVEPPAAAGLTLDASYVGKANYLFTHVNATADVFWCSAVNISGSTSPSCDITLQWDRPEYLYYEWDSKSGDLVGVPLQEAVGCNCTLHNETATGNSTTGNATVTQVLLCGNQNWSDSETCITDQVSYIVTCSAPTAPTLTNVTSSTTIRFFPAEPGTLYQCTVVVEFDAMQSTESRIEFVQVLDSQGKTPSTESVSSYWKLPVTHYDFSINHPDFGGSQTNNPSNPNYVASPFGGWLSTTSDPTGDTFTEWFRGIPGTNQEFVSDVYLESNASISNNTFRYFDDTFYPLDGIGYRSESQRDCDNVLHNFGFTTAIRTGLLFRGGETITVGGGDYMWLYINTILVAEYNNHADTSKVYCLRVEFSTAENGYVNITTFNGELISGSCAVSSTSVNEVLLNVEEDEIYHFDLYRVEREHCTSQFLLEVEDVTFNVPFFNGSTASTETTASPLTTQAATTTAVPTASEAATTSASLYTTSTASEPPTSDAGTAGTVVDTTSSAISATVATTAATTSTSSLASSNTRPPVDISISIPENTKIGSYVTSFGIADSYSLGPPFLLHITEGNEAGHFRVGEDNHTNHTLCTEPPPVAVARTVSNHTFLDCTAFNFSVRGSSPGNPAPLTVNSTTSNLYLQWELDYEEETELYLHVIIVDTVANRNGSLLIKISVTDVNDNCPLINSTGGHVAPVRPPLSDNVPLLLLNASDADSGVNAQIDFVLRELVERDSSIYGTKFVDYELIAYDKGTPSLGSAINLTFEISNTCLNSYRGRPLHHFIHVAKNLITELTEFYWRVPGYYSVIHDCESDLGLQSGLIPDQAMSASSAASQGECASSYYARYARLNYTNSTTEKGINVPGAWVPQTHDASQWIKVDFGYEARLHGMAIQGAPEFDYWVTEFALMYSNDDVTWNEYVPDYVQDLTTVAATTTETTAATTATNQPTATNELTTTNVPTTANQPSTTNQPTTTNEPATTTDCYVNTTTNMTSCQDASTTVTTTIATNSSSYIFNGSLIEGNSDADGVVSTVFEPQLVARYIRLHPVAWHGGIGVRMEFYGCNEAKKLRADSICFVCPAGYYCPGDGRKLPCGRCPDDGTVGDMDVTSYDPLHNDTCGRSPTEHSPGSTDECYPCPTGYVCELGKARGCPLHHYTEGCNATKCDECKPCEPGHACRSGVRYPCEPGQFSVDGQDEHCQRCLAGTFIDTYASTSCKNCPSGYQSCRGAKSCSPCRAGSFSFEGDHGCQGCLWECLCTIHEHPCFPGVQCVNVVHGNMTWDYLCLDCPVGFTGSGYTCQDIDECAISNPCFDPTMCVNTYGGFHCSGCPEGYYGVSYFGFGLDDTKPVQVCHDVDECSLSICDPLVQCNNTIGNYSCGQCPLGYTGTGYTKCHAPDPCQLTVIRTSCGAFTSCEAVSNHNAVCKCPHGTAGPGIACGDDIDFDGQPDLFISCGDWVKCAQDNCIGIPNSGQEDADGDRMGDACDVDDDNDFITDDKDNCPLVPNYVASGTQLDSDGDGYGDVCDTCPFVAGQFPDTDGDGLGDGCDDDDDNDGSDDSADLCPLDARATADSDGDGVGDICDNCVYVSNKYQADSNQNGVGNACDDGKDADGDSVLTFIDNCPFVPNPSQSDFDGDGIGDACDVDSENDGQPDSTDHCPYTNAPLAEDDSPCVDDYDNDGVDDTKDSCRADPTIQETTLEPYFLVHLGSGTDQAKWEVFNSGRAVTQAHSTDTPSMLIGEEQRYGAIDYTGGLFINEVTENGNYVGMVFAYQNNRKFYVVLWRNSHANDKNGQLQTGLKGLQVKVVQSISGPGTNLANALWHTADTANQVELIYHEPTLMGWMPKTPYLFNIQHRPSVGVIRVVISEIGRTILDTGPIYDTRYTGGRVGVFAYQQGNVIWSDLKVKCVARDNAAILLDGVDDHVILPSTANFNFEDSFTIETWIMLGSNSSVGKRPIVCSVNSTTLCLYLDNGLLKADFNGHTVALSSTLEPGFWQHVTLRFNAGACELTLLTNGSSLADDVRITDVPAIDWSTFAGNASVQLAIGWDGQNHFHGAVDDLRMYDRALLDTEVDTYLSQTGLPRHIYQRITTGFYDMNYHAKGSLVLEDHSNYANHGVIEGDPQFVESTADHARYRVANPTA